MPIVYDNCQCFVSCYALCYMCILLRHSTVWTVLSCSPCFNNMYVWFVIGVTSVFMISLSVCQGMPPTCMTNEWLNETMGSISKYNNTKDLSPYCWKIIVHGGNIKVQIQFDEVNLELDKKMDCHDTLQVFQFEHAADSPVPLNDLLTDTFCNTTETTSKNPGWSLLIRLKIGPGAFDASHGFEAKYMQVQQLLTTAANYNSTNLEGISGISEFTRISTEPPPSTNGLTTAVDNSTIKGATLETSSDVSGFNQLSTEPPPNTFTFTTAVNGGNKEERTANSSISAAYIVVPLLILLTIALVAVGIVIRKRRRGLVDKQSSSPRSFTNTTYSQGHILATPGANNNLQGDDVVYNSAYESSNGIKPSTNSDDPREGQVYNTAYQSVDDKGQSSQDVNNKPEYNYIDTERLGGESSYNVAYEGFDGNKANGNVLSDSSQVKGTDAEYNYVAPEKLGGDSTYNVAYGGFTEDKTDNNAADDPAYLEIKDGDEDPGNKYYTLEPR